MALRQINELGASLIKSFEKCRLKSYQGAADMTGTFTIGWGHVITGHEIDTHGIELFKVGQTIRDVTITQEVADKLFEIDINNFTKGVVMRLNKEIAPQLTDDQFGALVSLAYNVGLGNFKSSNILAKINNGDIEEAANGFKSWIRSGGEVRNGLIRRRAAEAALFDSDVDSMNYFLNNSDAKAIKKANEYLGRE